MVKYKNCKINLFGFLPILPGHHFRLQLGRVDGDQVCFMVLDDDADEHDDDGGDDDDDDDDDVCIEASDPSFVAIVGAPDLCIDASAACVPCVVASRLLPS